MDWTIDQVKALDIMYKNYNTEKFTFISGVAGSGKTSLLLEIISRLGLSEDSVRCLSYTGKASQVLFDKGLPNVSTIHSFLYYPVTDNYDNIVGWKIKSRDFFEDIELLIVDEISMVPNDVWIDLLSLGIHIICVGDLEQLPPIEDNNRINWYQMYRKRPHITIKNLICDYHMTQITRQSAESDIINQSLMIRNFGALKFLNQRNYKSNEVQIVSIKDVTEEMILSQDIILCATNVKRKALNQVVRSIKYSSLINSSEDLKYPQEDDTIICLENRWDCLNIGGNPIINGLRGRLDGYKITRTRFNSKTLYKMKCNFFANEDHHTIGHDTSNLFKNLNINYHNLLNESLLKAEYSILDKPISADYGYAISVHKSQGSEFNNVMIFEEGWPSESTLRNQFWYTALTRAKKHVIVVKPY